MVFNSRQTRADCGRKKMTLGGREVTAFRLVKRGWKSYLVTGAKFRLGVGGSRSVILFDIDKPLGGKN